MNQLPEALRKHILDVLEEKGNRSGIMDVQRISGGCIHHANRISTRDADYFLKWNEKAQPGMFAAEAHGLKLLADTRILRVPGVLAAESQANGYPDYILMEWIGSPSGARVSYDQTVLGNQLARMHKGTICDQGQNRYGLDGNNFIGELVQVNAWKDNWISFFRDNRLAPQAAIAARKNLLPSKRRHGLWYLMDHLDAYLGGHEVQACLLHGDLWPGNVNSSPSREPVLLDPAVYYGDRETDLAFSELFSGFGPQFYAAYADVYPLEHGYADRKLIYNIYHLLNHLNHFGEMYGRQIDAILSRFTQ